MPRKKSGPTNHLHWFFEQALFHNGLQQHSTVMPVATKKGHTILKIFLEIDHLSKTISRRDVNQDQTKDFPSNISPVSAKLKSYF